MGRTKTKISLNLYMNNVPIGTLTKLSNGALELRYERGLVESKNSIPLSLSLPLGLKKYSGDVVINYFDNLLPDNEGIRKALAQRMALDTQKGQGDYLFTRLKGEGGENEPMRRQSVGELLKTTLRRLKSWTWSECSVRGGSTNWVLRKTNEATCILEVGNL